MADSTLDLDLLVREFYLLKEIIEAPSEAPNGGVPLKPEEGKFLESLGLALPIVNDPKTTRDYVATISAKRVYQRIFNRKI